MASILDIAREQVPELEPVPEGEHQVGITKVVERLGDEAYNSGREGWDVFMRVDHPNSKTLVHRVFKPMESDDEDKANNMKRGIKRFVEAFDITSEDTDTWVGATSWAVLGIEIDAEYGDKNIVKRFLTKK